MCFFFFFFSSRRRHTRWPRDWSSDVCSSDLSCSGNPLDDRIAEQERRVEAQPGSADLRNDFGNLLAERRFVEDAQRQYEKAIELDSTNFLAAYNLGLLWEAEGRPSKAIWAYRKSTA